MSRRIEQDGKFFRIRRGKLVQIPPEWVGSVFFKRSISPRIWRKYFKRADKAKARNLELRFYRKDFVELGLNPQVLSL